MFIFKGKKFRSVFRKTTKSGLLFNGDCDLEFEYIEVGFIKKEIKLLMNNEIILTVTASGKGRFFWCGEEADFEVNKKPFNDSTITVILNIEKTYSTSVNFIKLLNGSKYVSVNGLGCVQISEEDIFFSRFVFSRFDEEKFHNCLVDFKTIQNTLPLLLLSILMVDLS